MPADQRHQTSTTGSHERHPEFEGVKPPGELHAIVGKAHLPERFTQIVGRGNSEGCHEVLLIAHQGAATLIGNRQPLVRIEGQGVGAFQATIPGGDARVKSAKGPIGPVDVQPEPFSLTDVRNGIERVDGSCVGGPGSGHHAKRLQVILAIAPYSSL